MQNTEAAQKTEAVQINHSMEDVQNTETVQNTKRKGDQVSKLENMEGRKKIKDMDVDERRSYHREQYRKRMEKLKGGDIVNLREKWSTEKELKRREKRCLNEEGFKQSRSVERVNERSKKRLKDEEGSKKSVPIRRQNFEQRNGQIMSPSSKSENVK